MRILITTDDLTFIGGIQSYLRQLCSSLAERGDSTDLFSPPGRPLRDPLSRWASLKYYGKFRRRLQEFKPDLVHAHSLSLQLSPLPLKAARELDIPVVMTVHDFNYVCPRKWMIRKRGEICASGIGLRCLWSNCRSGKEGLGWIWYHNLRWMKILLHRYLLKRYVRCFICPSSVLQETIARNWGISESSHVPNFIHSRSDPDLNRARNDLLYVGRLSPEKGVDILISAFPEILRLFPKMRLKIIGEGPERRRLMSLSEDAGLQSRILFIGEVENSKIREYFEAALLCLIPSLWMENCPVAVIEAMAAGCPQVGSRRGGIEELIVEGETGCCFRPGDPADLADKAIQLLRNPDRLSWMSQQSRAHYEIHYTRDAHMSRLLEVYNRVIAQR